MIVVDTEQMRSSGTTITKEGRAAGRTPGA
jgi:hypothetical protein